MFSGRLFSFNLMKGSIESWRVDCGSSVRLLCGDKVFPRITDDWLPILAGDNDILVLEVALLDRFLLLPLNKHGLIEAIIMTWSPSSINLLRIQSNATQVWILPLT